MKKLIKIWLSTSVFNCVSVKLCFFVITTRNCATKSVLNYDKEKSGFVSGCQCVSFLSVLFV